MRRQRAPQLLHAPTCHQVTEVDREEAGGAKTPGKPELPGPASRALPSARNERRHGSEVIRVGRMT